MKKSDWQKVPIALNVAIVLALAVRLYFVLPWYLDLFSLSIGVPTQAAIDTSAYTTAELRSLTLRRAGTVLLDFVLFRFLGSWAWLFFVGDGLSNPAVSPARWRYALGYKPAEVVVRASRRWGAPDFWAGISPGAQILPQDAVMRERLAPNLDPDWMRDRTGYMMMGRDFELDFGAMLHAHDLLDGREPACAERDFELCALVRAKDGADASGWCIWRVAGDEAGADDVAGGSGAEGQNVDADEEAARARIHRFRERLLALDKESLFYRFIEIVQYEGNQPGGLTAKRRKRVLEKAREIFDRAVVDLDKFIEDLGGEDQLPGFDQP